MSKEFLGEFEELVLTMVGILQEDAIRNAIVAKSKERLGRESNLSAFTSRSTGWRTKVL